MFSINWIGRFSWLLFMGHLKQYEDFKQELFLQFVVDIANRVKVALARQAIELIISQFKETPFISTTVREVNILLVILFVC